MAGLRTSRDVPSYEPVPRTADAIGQCMTSKMYRFVCGLSTQEISDRRRWKQGA